MVLTQSRGLNPRPKMTPADDDFARMPIPFGRFAPGASTTGDDRELRPPQRIDPPVPRQVQDLKKVFRVSLPGVGQSDGTYIRDWVVASTGVQRPMLEEELWAALFRTFPLL